MQWGGAFADLCFKHQVRLVNYPRGMKAIGTPGGITGSALMPLDKVKVIVGKYVRFWRQEGRELKAQAMEELNPGHVDTGAGTEEEDKDEGPVFEEDLVRFVPWKQGKLSDICLSTEMD